MYNSENKTCHKNNKKSEKFCFLTKQNRKKIAVSIKILLIQGMDPDPSIITYLNPFGQNSTRPDPSNPGYNPS